MCVYHVWWVRLRSAAGMLSVRHAGTLMEPGSLSVGYQESLWRTQTQPPVTSIASQVHNIISIALRYDMFIKKPSKLSQMRKEKQVQEQKQCWVTRGDTWWRSTETVSQGHCSWLNGLNCTLNAVANLVIVGATLATLFLRSNKRHKCHLRFIPHRPVFR